MACRIAGIPKPDRLRSWHSRDGLHVGATAGEAGKRRYSFGDVVTLRLVNDLARALPLPAVISVAMTLKDRLNELALISNVLDLHLYLVIGMSARDGDPVEPWAKIVNSAHGDAGPATLAACEGEHIAITYNLSRCIWRTQRAYDEVVTAKGAADA